MKDEFLAILGHELRNPLAPILTAVQLMRLRGDLTSQREQNIIERQVNHLIGIVDDLLDISRVARGKIQLDRRPLELHALLAAAIEIASPLFEQRAQHLEVHAPEAEICLDADQGRLSQVVTNLLSNAAKYTPARGHIAVDVAHEGACVAIHVKDNGKGIAPALLPHIFDLFVQGERSRDRQPAGLGIGLALVRSLVQLHGGRVTAASEGSGRVSEFTVVLPVLAARDAGGAAQDSLHARVAATARRILVVDDNEDAGELLGEMLRSIGYDVVIALDGPRALEATERVAPDIAILDIGLPIMDGYELATALRTRFGKRLRLVALTGYGQEQDKRRAIDSGFEAHLVKPVAATKLFAAIEADASRAGCDGRGR
jgi:CheY-like chemotaxis protein